MRSRLFWGLVACGLIGATSALAQSPPAPLAASASQNASEEDGVRVAVNAYLQGHATGDPAYFRKAFLPTAHIEGVRGGKFTSWTVDDYCALFKGVPAADEATRTRSIDSIDISGTAAMAKATLTHGATVFTDYLVLLKVDGEWKIANKVYAGRPKGA
jgi:hypothetical protein